MENTDRINEIQIGYENKVEKTNKEITMETKNKLRQNGNVDTTYGNLINVETEQKNNHDITNAKTNENNDEPITNNAKTEENKILDKYDIFENVYSFSDDFVYIDEESTSSKNLDDSKKKHVLSMVVNKIVNIYPNNEKNREFRKYKEKKIEEKKKRIQHAEQERLAQKKKKYEEKRKQKLEIYRVEKTKRKLVERKKYSIYNIEQDYLVLKNYYESLHEKGKCSDICVSFHNYYLSPMILYYFININVNELYYLDLSRKWLLDSYIPVVSHLCGDKKVKCLNLSFNRLTHMCLPILSALLSKNKYLISIDLQGNNLTNNGKNPDVLNTLFKSLEKNRTLKCISLASSKLNPENGEALCQILNVNTTLTEINVDDNNLTYFQIRSIIECLKRNQKLKLAQTQMGIEEHRRMHNEEIYMNTYIMALEASTYEIENREQRKSLNKMMYINMWREEIQEKEKREEEILNDLKMQHLQRIKDLERKKQKQKKNKK